MDEVLALVAERLVSLEKAVEVVSKQPGPQGPAGAAGMPGAKGDTGERGQDGLPGAKGDTGERGQDGLPGAKGDTGERGLPGAKGDTGPQGKDGARGPKGDTGPQGKDGERGPKGDRGPMPAHEWSGTRLRFQTPEGKWGKFVDLEGPRGLAGGGGGGSRPTGLATFERSLRTDFTDAHYWFVEYASRIKRLDQSVSPAAVGFAVGAWADRLTLTYA